MMPFKSISLWPNFSLKKKSKIQNSHKSQIICGQSHLHFTPPLIHHQQPFVRKTKTIEYPRNYHQVTPSFCFSPLIRQTHHSSAVIQRLLAWLPTWNSQLQVSKWTHVCMNPSVWSSEHCRGKFRWWRTPRPNDRFRSGIRNAGDSELEQMI